MGIQDLRNDWLSIFLIGWAHLAQQNFRKVTKISNLSDTSFGLENYSNNGEGAGEIISPNCTQNHNLFVNFCVCCVIYLIEHYNFTVSHNLCCLCDKYLLKMLTGENSRTHERTNIQQINYRCRTNSSKCGEKKKYEKC